MTGLASSFLVAAILQVAPAQAQPAQIVISLLVVTIGSGLTTTSIVSVFEQPLPSITVRTYSVVITGDAIGSQILGSSNPVIGLHVQLIPPEPFS